jgi:hypothetical protein
MSKIFQKIGDAIAECDWFAAPILLRFHGEEDKKTKTGGFISLLLIIFLASAFSSSWMDALNKK